MPTLPPVTAPLLHAIALEDNAEVSASLAPELEAQCAPAGIDTRLRLAHFLAQGCYESGFFRRLAENLNYSAARIAEVWPRLRLRAGALAGHPEALANAAYAGVNGNGDEASGDGWRYRGRGLFQLTGRANYASIGAYAERDLAGDPDSVASPAIAVATAIDYWHAVGASAAADADNIGRVTHLINGAYLGLADRDALKRRALRLLTASRHRRG